MNRFPALVYFLNVAIMCMQDGVPFEIMSNCQAHGIRPQASKVFCRSCGALHKDTVDFCTCGSDHLSSMCDLCEEHFRKVGRVPVERAN